MHPKRIAVFLPCHTLDDFPTWLDEREADELLAAWTAAWDPRLIAAIGAVPGWASVDVPPQESDEILGIVPAQCDERFSVMVDAAGMGSMPGMASMPGTNGFRWVRQVQGRREIAAAALAQLDQQPPPATAGVAVTLADDFYALGLAWLLSELLARRMRSSTSLGATNFEEACVAAAQAAVAGDEPLAREKLRECFGVLEATRAQYYPVDFWLLDLVLLAESTLGARLAAELDVATPLALVASGRVVETLAHADPALLARVRQRIEADTLAIVGGRQDATPLDFCTLATIRESFARGYAVYLEHLGVVPKIYGQCTGGSSAFLPAILSDLDYTGAIWNLFDGTRLPDPGTSRIRWQGTAGECIDAVARPPLDARSALTVLALAEKIGDALDHDHAAVIQFAHYAGTASPWFDDLRRIGSWSTALGTFATPDKVFANTAGTGTLADFAPDAFPPTLPDAPAEKSPDPIGSHMAAARDEARRIVAAEPALADIRARLEGTATPVATAPPPKNPPALWQTVARGLFGGPADATERFLLETDQLCLRVNPKTGGILSLRSVPRDLGNQLSQQLSLRTTRPAPPPGSAWEDTQERAVYSSMVADRIDRDSHLAITSHGRLVDAAGRDVGSFTQRVALVPGLSIARLDIELTVPQLQSAGPLLEEYAACRFAWNENEDIDLCRSLHAEPVVTERARFTAPHFLELRQVGARGDKVLICTGGLPWHVRAAPHMVDSVLLAGGRQAGAFHLAVGLGIDQPREVALALLADGRAPSPAGIPG